MPGLFEKRTPDIFLNTIESVVVQQGIVGRMISFGTVILRDRDGTVTSFEEHCAANKVSMEIA